MTVQGKWWERVVLVFLGVLAFQAELHATPPDRVIGALYEYNESADYPLPLQRYTVYLFDLSDRKWRSPALTDQEGNFAFFNLREDTYLMRIYRSLGNSRHMVWQQEINAPSDGAAIVLPFVEKLNLNVIEVDDKEETTTLTVSISINPSSLNRIQNVVWSSTTSEDGGEVTYQGNLIGPIAIPVKSDECSGAKTIFIKLVYESRYTWIEFDACEILSRRKQKGIGATIFGW